MTPYILSAFDKTAAARKCLYIEGDTKAPGATICAAIRQPGVVYCPEHQALCVQGRKAT